MSGCNKCGGSTPTPPEKPICDISMTPLMVDVYEDECGVFPVVKRKCQIVKYKDNYHVSLVDGATGDPTLASNHDFSEAMTASEAIVYLIKNCN